MTQQSYQMYETLKEALGAETLLDDIYQAMSEDEAIEMFKFIINQRDIEL